MTARKTPPKWARAQRGAAGIEFAFLFTIFFGVFYAVISYAFVTLLQQGLAQASAEGARAAVRLDPTQYNATQALSFQTDTTKVAQDATRKALSWMPSAVQAKLNNAVEVSYTTSKIPLANGTTLNATDITVKVTYADYPADPMLPLITLPGLGTIPTVPQNLIGSSTVRISP